jgi:superfamily II DNA or RNA helicase
VIAADMVRGSLDKKIPSFFCVHRQELIDQTSAMFSEFDIPHGFIASGYKTNNALSHICSVQTLVRRKSVPKPKVIYIDEAHHATANTYQKIIDRFPQAKVIGLTATPCRTDGQGLGDIFDVMVEGPSIKWLIKNNFLSKFKVFAPPSELDLSSVKNYGGDYSRSQLSDAVDKPTITGDAVKHYKKILKGQRAICFCVSVKHSQHVCERFKKAGINAAHVDGKTKEADRRRIMSQFSAGDIQVLCNVDIISEGFDVPECQGVILLRPTQSLSLYLQQVGRALRYRPNKTAIILDHVGNVLRHDMPDADREWSLKGKAKRRGKKRNDAEPEINVRQCPECFAAHKTAPKCPQCGHVYEVQSREVEKVDGDLKEVSEAEVKARKRRRRREVAKARTKAELMAIAKKRGYNPGWVKHMMKARRKKAKA